MSKLKITDGRAKSPVAEKPAATTAEKRVSMAAERRVSQRVTRSTSRQVNETHDTPDETEEEKAGVWTPGTPSAPKNHIDVPDQGIRFG
jgi:hypothetical protein